MKAITFASVASVIVMLAATSPAQAASKTLTPPSWIQGTWVVGAGTVTFTFTEHDVKAVYKQPQGEIKTDYGDLPPVDTILGDASTDHDYSFEMKEGNIDQVLRFTKTNDHYVAYVLTQTQIFNQLDLKKQ